MLKHDKYWNWNVKTGDKVIYEGENKDGLNRGEIYEVVYPQGTPSGICVKNDKGEHIWGKHEWFCTLGEKIEKL